MADWKKYIPAECTLVVNEPVAAYWVLEAPGRTDVILLTAMSNIHHVHVLSVFPARVTVSDNEFVNSYLVDIPLPPAAAAIAAGTKFSVLADYSTTTTRPKSADVLEFLHALVSGASTSD